LGSVDSWFDHVELAVYERKLRSGGPKLVAICGFRNIGLSTSNEHKTDEARHDVSHIRPLLKAIVRPPLNIDSEHLPLPVPSPWLPLRPLVGGQRNIWPPRPKAAQVVAALSPAAGCAGGLARASTKVTRRLKR